MSVHQLPTRDLKRLNLEAERAVCQYLVHACRQAMYEMALDQETDPDVRRRAIQILKEVHSDWLEAHKALRREARLEGRLFTNR